MAYRRSNTMYDAMMSGISSLGGIADTINGAKKQDSELKLRAAQLKEAEMGQEIKGQEIAKNKETAAQAIARKQLIGSMESGGELAPKAMVGTPTATGTAVDFQDLKKSRQYDQDAKAWNQFNQDRPGFVPMTGEKLRTEADGKALKGAQADQAEVLTDERATETHKSKMANDKAARETGRYTPVVLDGNNLGAMNTRTGGVKSTGEKTLPKVGANVPVDGETAIPGMKPIAGVQITKDSVTKVKDAYAKYTDFKNQLTEYKSLIEKNGAEAFGENADEMEAYGTGLVMTLKELQALGVLNGPDLALLQKQIPAAAGPMAAMKSAAYGAVGQNSLAPRLDALGSTMDSKFSSMAKANGFQLGAPSEAPAAAAAPGAVDKRSLAEQALNDPEATEQEKAAARRILGK